MEKKTKKSGRESAWNSRIATFPKEIDIETYLHLSQKEYELRAERYAERGVNLVNATINFHFRFDWIRHFDEIAEITSRITEACHKYGMRVYEHHSANLISRHKDETYLGWNPEDSLVVDIRTGLPSRTDSRSNNRFVCINNPEFKEKFKGYILDFIKKTGVDGLMHDDIHFAGQYNCGCNYCRAKFKKIFGYNLPDFGKFPIDDCTKQVWRDWLRFRLISSSDQLRELKEVLPEDFLLFSCMSAGVLNSGDIHHAGASMETFARGTNCVFSEGGNLYIKNRGSWRPRNFFGNWEKLYVEKKYIKAISTSFSQPALDLHYPADPKEGFFCWALTKIFGNCLWRCDTNLYGGHNYDDEFREWQKEYDYFNWERKNERLFGISEGLNEIGVVFSQNTKLAMGVNPQHHGEPFAGWMQTLQEYGFSADCLIDRDLENYEKISSLKLLVLPNVSALSKNAAENIKRYVYNGGRLLATHKTSLMDETGKDTGNFQLSDIFGCRFLEETPEESYWFIENRFSGETLFAENFPVFKTFPSVSVSWEGETEKTDVLGWKERTTVWHEEPHTPAVTRVHYGKGEVVYMAPEPGLHSYREGLFNIWNRIYRSQRYEKGVDTEGRGFNEWIVEENRNPGRWFFIDNSDRNYRILIRNLVGYMLPQPSIRVLKPPGVIFNLFLHPGTDKGNCEWVIGLLNVKGAELKNLQEVSPPSYLHYPSFEGEITIKVSKDAMTVKRAVFYSPDIKDPVVMNVEDRGTQSVLKLDFSVFKRAGFILLQGGSYA
jgi:hypothetical protein